ncbi:unnamed protein product [[Candida] boidinii]|nr:unnamed protein product [[Candida] boidinii]
MNNRMRIRFRFRFESRGVLFWLYSLIDSLIDSLLHATYSAVSQVGMFLLFLCSGPAGGSPAGGSPSSCPSMLESAVAAAAAAAAAAVVVEILWIRLFPDSASGDISVFQYFRILLAAARCMLHSARWLTQNTPLLSARSCFSA